MKNENGYQSSLMRKRLLKRHARGQTWREIAGGIGLNVSYVYNFAVHGVEPPSPAVRVKLGLKAKCPRCKRRVTLAPMRRWHRLSSLSREQVLYLLEHREEM
jgi:hypothetical protein